MAIRTLLRHLQHLWASLILRLQIILDYTVQTAGPLYIILAFSLISTVTYLFFTTVLPAIHDIYSFQGCFHILISSWLIFNVFFNYFYCIYTDPGTPSNFDPGGDLSKYEMGISQMRWCKRCHRPKPPMTHHCHICNRCILKMDHHCPWMHNCIGFYNYRFFFLFLVYLWLGCVYTTLMASIPLLRSANTWRVTQDPKDLLDLESGKMNGVLFTFVLALAVFCSLSCLLGWHVYLVLTAQTTIDFYANHQRRREGRGLGVIWINEYNLGKLQNFRNVFDLGDRYWWLTFLLPSRRPPVGDGTRFPTQNNTQELLNMPSNSSTQPLDYQYYHLSSSLVNGSTSTNHREVLTLERAMAEETWGTSDMV